jgi:hypothetical protein
MIVEWGLENGRLEIKRMEIPDSTSNLQLPNPTSPTLPTSSKSPDSSLSPAVQFLKVGISASEIH